MTLREMFLSAAMRGSIQEAFACRVVNSYGASEFLTLACECSRGSLHLNSDWAILESVDDQGAAVAPGTSGAATLLTNLANHVQPLIRYDIGDRVTIHPQACSCGSSLPVIEVQGRCDDILRLGARGKKTLSVLPLALTTVLEDDAGLFDFQLVQTGRRELQLVTPRQGSGADADLRRARTILASFLAGLGAEGLRIRCCSGQPRRLGRTGKLQRVIAAPG